MNKADRGFFAFREGEPVPLGSLAGAISRTNKLLQQNELPGIQSTSYNDEYVTKLGQALIATIDVRRQFEAVVGGPESDEQTTMRKVAASAISFHHLHGQAFNEIDNAFLEQNGWRTPLVYSAQMIQRAIYNNMMQPADWQPTAGIQDL